MNGIEFLTRPPILVALDQANALYCTTAYADTVSKPLTSDRFRAIQTFYKLLNQKHAKNTAFIIAQDTSRTQIHSFHLNKLGGQAKVLNKDPSLLPVKRYADLPNLDPEDCVLPLDLDPAQKDLFPRKDPAAAIHNLQSFTIPRFLIEETEPMLKFYKQSNVYFGGIVD